MDQRRWVWCHEQEEIISVLTLESCDKITSSLRDQNFWLFRFTEALYRFSGLNSNLGFKNERIPNEFIMLPWLSYIIVCRHTLPLYLFPKVYGVRTRNQIQSIQEMKMCSSLLLLLKESMDCERIYLCSTTFHLKMSYQFISLDHRKAHNLKYK